MTTATLVLVAALLALAISPLRVLAILMLIALLYFNPIPTAITLGLFGILYTFIKRNS